MNGAETLVHTLLDGGVDVCFANPGTSEMHFVAALDRIAGMRCVLGLFEGVVTGAADGYYRIADRPAATLLHLGPGLANGLANLHNAKKARSGIVNVVGEHAASHRLIDAPLSADVEGLARPMSHWVRTCDSVQSLVCDGAQAVRAARGRPAGIATLILPADVAWSDVPAPGHTAPAERVLPSADISADGHMLSRAAEALRAGASTLLLLGGAATRARATEWAGRLARRTGCTVMSDYYAPRLERGAGRVAIPRLPYPVQPRMQALRRFERIVLVGAQAPVAFFGYPDQPAHLAPPGCDIVDLAGAAHDPAALLRELWESVGGGQVLAPEGVARASGGLPRGALEPEGIGRVLAAVMPENAIVVDEALTTGRGFDAATAAAAPHDWLMSMGASIGFCLPAAVGAAIAAPGRRVLALEGDGSGMYTLQAMWTMAREGLPVTVVIFANRAYRILHGEFTQVGAGAPGQRATDMLSLERPALDWCALARGMGVDALRVTTLEGFAEALLRSFRNEGPTLVEVVL